MLPLIASLAALSGPLAPAGEGKAQCYGPDPARKTCSAMATYTARPDGWIDNHARVLISPEPAVVMETVTPLQVRGEQVCGAVRRWALEQATFTVGGAALDAQRTAAARARMIATLEPFMEEETCTTYRPAGDRLTAEVTFAGIRVPMMDQAVIWVSEADGYTVAP